MKTGKALVCLIICLALLSSCKKGSEDTLVVILWDNSKSTAPAPNAKDVVIEDWRPHFLSASREIVSSAGPGFTIVGGRITDRSLRIASLPVSVRFPTFSPIWDNPHIFKANLLKAKQEALRQIDQAINAEKRTSSTCIVDSLILAQQIFESERRSRKILVIFSDMVEDCEGIDFDTNPRTGAQGAPTAATDAKNLIAQLKHAGKLPNLAGVEIHVYGATGGQRQDDTSDRFILIRNLWQELFKAAGAEVKHYGVFVKPPVSDDSMVNVPLAKNSWPIIPDIPVKNA